MIPFVLGVAVLCASTPCEFVVGTATWPGERVVEFDLRVVNAEGVVFERSFEIGVRNTPSQVRELVQIILDSGNCRVRPSGNEAFVIESYKGKPIRSVEFRGKDWVPTVARVPIPKRQ